MNENMISDTNDEIANVDSANTLFTPYQCATVVNAWLQEKGIVKELPPQMFYTYVKKGYIASLYVDDKRFVELETLQNWFVAYVRKNVLKQVSALKIPSAPDFD
jgi:hypothetical protein